MRVEKPANEDAVLPTLSETLQARYNYFKAAANRVGEKFPDTDTKIYTQYLSDYLTTAQQFKVATKTPEGQPLDPRYVRDQVSAMENKLAKRFDEKYPVYAAAGDDKGAAVAAKNMQALRRLKSEIDGDNMFTRFIKAFYDEDRGGFQFSSVTGGIIGLLTGGLMGSYLAANAGAMGAGGAGTAAMVLLGGAGMVFGAQVMYKLFNPPATAGTDPAKPAPGQGQQPAQGTAPGQPAPTVSTARYLFTPTSTQIASAPANTQFIPVVQHGGGLTQLADKDPQMTIDGHYVFDENNAPKFQVRNANMHTTSGKKPIGVDGVFLSSDKDGKINLAASENIDALNRMDQVILASVSRAKTRIEQALNERHPEREQTIKLYDEISSSEILKPSSTPIQTGVDGTTKPQESPAR